MVICIKAIKALRKIHMQRGGFGVKGLLHQVDGNAAGFGHRLCFLFLSFLSFFFPRVGFSLLVFTHSKAR